jgi:hypothetical protein
LNLKKLLSFFFLLFSLAAYAQDSSRMRISLLTCTPGDDLYSLFGHSALRVIDSNSVTDHVYNYGTFNFEDKNFYIKFARGKLNYCLSVEQFEEFKYLYQVTNRGITEQLLALTAAEKIAIKNFLTENAKEENRYYQYDFFFDNCTTRLRDIILKMKQPAPLLPAVRPANMRFRQAIHEYLDKGDQQWSKLGIDLLLGAKTDRVMTAAEQQFLPDNLMMAIDRSSNVKLVADKQSLYEVPAVQKSKNIFTPLVFFLVLFLFFVLMHFLCVKKYPLMLSGLDGMLFFLTGFLGIILVLMWVATDHSMTKNNYNLLWALPTHAVFAFFVKRKNSSTRSYFKFTAIAGLLLILAWFLLPQQLNPAFIPFVATLVFRAWMISRKNSIPKKVIIS